MGLQIYVHHGSSALSGFRRQRLGSKIGATEVRANYVHFVALYETLTQAEQANLNLLLTYDDVPPDAEPSHDAEPAKGKTYIFYVFPRKGTISPWSSKATSIAHVCGLQNKLKRIERGIIFSITIDGLLDDDFLPSFVNELHDRMTQIITRKEPDLNAIFAEQAPAPATIIPIIEATDPIEALEEASKTHNLSLDASEVAYLAQAYSNTLRRDPYLEELFMFAQIQSEHCRHKTFNATWIIDGDQKVHSLFDLIRHTHQKSPQHVISAYSDNASVMEGVQGSLLAPEGILGSWKETPEQVHYLAKVESHNHPTAVSPFPGAATGVGGALRDDGSVGRGSRPKTGLCGFCVSDLLIPGFRQPWELDIGKPFHIASSLEIMTQAPLGAASYNNEFGRPCTAGFFRSLTTMIATAENSEEIRGYHKPVMLTGGIGQVRPQMALKNPEIVPTGAFICIIGGPAMLIGLGGGTTSSIASSDAKVELDFASVQRGNAEVQRRAQEVISACNKLGIESPILFIHDVGAGGLSNALPELVFDCSLGATFELRDIHNADSSMSPLQIWSCEAQERYVVAIAPERFGTFKDIAERERCGYCLVGKTTGNQDGEKRLILSDRDSNAHPVPIDLPMSVLFGKRSKIRKAAETRKLSLPPFDSTLSTYLPKVPTHCLLEEAVSRVLVLPAVASKSFLITIGDRSVGGLTTRDQLVGPWATPVADVSVTATSLTVGIKTGEAMAIGEKPTIALISPKASVRMALAESLLNLAAACLNSRLQKVVLSANWMCAASHHGEGAALYTGVEAMSNMCQNLGVSIPVGKDSVSMKMKWTDRESKEAKEVTAPLTLVATAFAPVTDITKTWTPTLRRLEAVGETIIIFVDLAHHRKALGGSALAQVFGQVGDVAPDVHDLQLLKNFFDAIEQLQEAGIVLAYHDRSDGGLFTTLVEMMFAGRCGMDVMLDGICSSPDAKDVMETLFNEELGAVFQISKKHERNFLGVLVTCGCPPELIKNIGRIPPETKQELRIHLGQDLVYCGARGALQQRWASTSYLIQRLRDNSSCADAEHASLLDNSDPGLSYNLTFFPSSTVPSTNALSKPLATSLNTLSMAPFSSKPKIAILREQGTNGAPEMAFAFLHSGFTPVDVHMTDLIYSRVSLSQFTGLAACGGFSYGDVLSAGQGWAKSVLLHPKVCAEFQTFFSRPETFTLGVCNGCQFLTRLRQLIPGTERWPTFERNRSEQYEARVCMVEILDTPDSAGNPELSVFLHGMHGSSLPIAVAHGEGRASFFSSSSASPATAAQTLLSSGGVALRYVKTDLQPADADDYPANPNGSPLGIAGVRSADGRVLALMPHPERTVLRGVGSYIPENILREWKEMGPWSRIFENARRWVG